MPEVSKGTAQTGGGLVFKGNTGATTQSLEIALQQINNLEETGIVMRRLSQCSDATGGYVQFASDFHHAPVLVGTDGQPVPLFYVLEVLDETLDYEKALSQLPTLSYVQIVGALAFLRKVVQANTSDINFDAVEDYQLSNDTDFIGVLRDAIADKEIARVLHRG